MFQTVTDAHGLFCAHRAEFQSLYHYRPWAPSQGQGYIPYMRTLWWDHSFSYDDSLYQNPLAHRNQKAGYDAYSASKANLLGVLNGHNH